jgi:hypothetical protein
MCQRLKARVWFPHRHAAGVSRFLYDWRTAHFDRVVVEVLQRSARCVRHEFESSFVVMLLAMRASHVTKKPALVNSSITDPSAFRNLTTSRRSAFKLCLHPSQAPQSHVCFSMGVVSTFTRDLTFKFCLMASRHCLEIGRRSLERNL